MTNFEVEKEQFKTQIATIEDTYGVKVLLAYVRGSHMYGTNRPESDVDITFVYIQHTDDILRGDYREQINLGGNDIVGYEVQRFLDLLSQNNPNILESLDIPEDCLIVKSPVMDRILKQELWLSKLVRKTLLGYAQSQVNKATGLHKNMNNPQPKERKSILDFSYIIQGAKSIPFMEWYADYIDRHDFLDDEDLDHNNWGLVKNPNGKGLYALYPSVNSSQKYRGLIKDNTSTQLRLSEIPKEDAERIVPAILYYNLDGFEVHCKQHASYWKWFEEKNEDRHNTNVAHGKNYDSKNMMHLFRLLAMAHRISLGEGMKVREDDTEWLMDIRNGLIEYDELMENANFLEESINTLFDMVDLPESPDIEMKKDLVLKFRKLNIE